MPSKEFIIVVFIALSRLSGQGTTCSAQDRYDIDLDNSKIAFSIKHLGVLAVNGRFDEFSGTLEYENERLVSIQCEVVTKSANTENNSRDEAIIGEAYLNAENYPFITFYSEEITADTITGRLKIKDVERSINLGYDLNDSEVNGVQILTASFMIRREDFSLEFGSMDGLIGKEISLDLTIAFYKD